MEINKVIKVLIAIILFMVIVFNLLAVFIGFSSYYDTQKEVDRIMQLDSIH